MAQYLSNELAGTSTGTSTAAGVGYKPRASVYGGRLKRLRATITFASQTTSDTIVLGNLPAGAVFAFGTINVSATTGSATLAIGVSGTAAKYAAASAYTTADTPTLFGKNAVVAASDSGLAAEEQVIATIAGASLPASGTAVVDLFYSSAN
jgi:hypothetical protein